MIKVGDKVVCVDDSRQKGFLKRKQIYTVSEIIVCPKCGLIAYRLSEVTDTGKYSGTVCDCSLDSFMTEGFLVFSALRFRPLEYPKLTYAEIARAEVKEGTDVPAEVRERELCN